jgi:hypothetical protein
MRVGYKLDDRQQAVLLLLGRERRAKVSVLEVLAGELDDLKKVRTVLQGTSHAYSLVRSLIIDKAGAEEARARAEENNDLPYGWWAREPLTEGCLFPRS